MRAVLSSPLPSVLVGDAGVVRRALALVAADTHTELRVIERMSDWRAGALCVLQKQAPLLLEQAVYGAPSAAAGRAQLAWIDTAMRIVRERECAAMVTGPVSKEAVVRGGLSSFRGHTEYLQHALGAAEVVMAFWSPGLVTSLVTTHLPLSQVPSAITPAAVATSSYWLAKLMADLGDARPVAVAGLNPHAGEAGLLGHEESFIAEGMRLAAERLGREAFVGPVPAETAFRKAQTGAYAGVVAMYHDQATIPMKLTGFGDAVNVSLGLPIVRTSVDHGTGYDIAGKGIADAKGMMAAIDLAARLVR